MLTKIIKIGNSKGLRISKSILERYNIGEQVNIRLEEEYLIIEPIAKPRANWDIAFKKMSLKNEDKLLIPDVFEDEGLWD
ncbi:MAG: AbrB/MazE/SpoVT family DNA-binding domain-containing protein [Saprospiraceae bacterium]